MTLHHRLLLAVVPIRIVLDLVGAPTIGPVSVAWLGAGAIALGLAVRVGVCWRSAVSHPWRVPMAAFAVALGIGAIRADSALDAARYGLHLGTPILWLLALHTIRPANTLPPAWTLAAVVPIASSVAALIAGQPALHVLHGWPRLHGAYGDLHPHAAAMAVFATSFLVWGIARRSGAHVVLGGLASLCVAATWVRTAWIWVALAIVAALLARRRTGVAAGLVGVGTILALTVLRARWSDALSLLTLTPPPGGWGALGSWRGRIWTDSLANFLAGPPLDIALGRGLGGQYGLHRHLDPHSEWLALLYQLGPLGLLAWFAWTALALRDLGRLARRSDTALVAFALLAGAFLTSAVSNDWLVRGTSVLWTFGLAGLALRSASPGSLVREPAPAEGPAADGTAATDAPPAA